MRTSLLVLLAAFAVGAASLANGQDAVEPYLALSSYDFGKPRDPLNAINASIRAASNDTAQLAAIETKLTAALQPGLPAGAKDFICGSLAVIGTERCVPAVAKLLAEERDADQARRVLERLPAAAAGKALRSALTQTSGRTRIGVIHSLGERRDGAAVASLAGLLADPDAQTADAAARALGRIGSADALRALLDKGDVAKASVADGLLLCADASDSTARAAAAYEKVFRSSTIPAVRQAAFAGWARVAPEKARGPLMELLGDAKPENQDLAVQLAQTVRTPGLGKALAGRLPGLAPRAQAALLAALGNMGDAAARPVAIELTGSTNEEVRTAAVESLALLPGDAAAVDALVRIAAAGAGPLSRKAVTSLTTVRGGDVDDALIRGAAKGEVAARKVCINVLGERQAAAARSALLKLRGDGEIDLRREALKALEKIGTGKDYEQLIAWMLGATDEREVQAAERAVLKVAARIEDPTAALIAADPKATVAGRGSLARCLSRLGGGKGLALMRDYVKRGETETVLAAVRALAAWPDATALTDLVAIATGRCGDAKVETLACRGALQMLENDATQTADQKADWCDRLIERSSPGDRKFILTQLPTFAGAKAMALAQSYTRNPEYAAEANAALLRMRELASPPPTLTASHNGGETGKAMDRDKGTRWSSNAGMSAGMWLQLDLHLAKSVKRIVLDSEPSPNDYPRGYEVYIGDDPAKFGAPVLKGEGSKPVTEFTIEPPRVGRYVKIVQTGRADQWFWSVHELTIDAELGSP